MLKRILDYAVYVLARVVFCAVQAIPLNVLQRAARGFAWLAVDVLGVRRHTIEVNLRQAFPHSTRRERLAIARGMWEHVVLMVCEIAILPRKLHRTNWRRWIRVSHNERLMRYAFDPRPMVIVTGQFGNFEVGGYLCGFFGIRTFTVARTLDKPYLDEWSRRFRESTGHVMIDKRGGGVEMQERLENGGHLALLADQDAGRRGTFVSFFGRPASTYKSIAVLALRYDALICVGYSIRLPEDAHSSAWVKYELGCEAVLDARDYDSRDAIQELTQDYTAALERAVRRAPEQYFWVHRRWKTAPKEKQSCKRLKKAG